VLNRRARLAAMATAASRRKNCAGESAIQRRMSGTSDLEIYQRFTAIADEFDRVAAQGVSLIGGTALSTACRALRGLATAIYEHSLSQPEQDSLPQ
jgi:hypothetical protein